MNEIEKKFIHLSVAGTHSGQRFIGKEVQLGRSGAVNIPFDTHRERYLIRLGAGHHPYGFTTQEWLDPKGIFTTWSGNQCIETPSSVVKYKPHVNVEFRNKLKETWPDIDFDKLASGDADLVLDYSLEGFTPVDWDAIKDLFGLQSLKQLVWITSIFNTETLKESPNDVDVRFHPCFLWQLRFWWWSKGNQDPRYTLGFTENLINRIEEKTIRPYYSTVYARRPRRLRNLVQAILKTEGALDNQIWSYGNVYDYKSWAFKDAKYDKYREAGLELQTIEHSPTGEDLVENKAQNINWDHVNNTYFQFIQETIPADFGTFSIEELRNDYTFLSEKAFKPFLSMQPFVMAGDVHTVKALEEMGFDVFHDYINHNYDNIYDTPERLHQASLECVRLSNISKEEWSNMLLQMLPRLIKNREHFMNHQMEYIHKDIISEVPQKEWSKSMFDEWDNVLAYLKD